MNSLQKSSINRHIVGARDILLRALVDQPHWFSVAVSVRE